MKSIKEMLKIIPIPHANQGGMYCNAIDEDPNNPSECSNNMPNDGYQFYTDDDTGNCSVSYITHFSSYDGWDTCSDDCGTFPSYYDAVEVVYMDMEYNILRDKLRRRLRKFYDIALRNWSIEVDKVGRRSADQSIILLFVSEMNQYNYS